MTGRWAGVIAAAENLQTVLELAADEAAVIEAAGELLAELANLWAAAEPAAGVLTSPGTPAAGADPPTVEPGGRDG